ncbi:DNA ligase D [Edaphobacter aggregans]|uniref:DNA ligase D n=1 Tax=Edaphobacter aggregans TaxID=570835 RepID=UPI00068A2BA8|nr:DNA ligase D [Edaphobacter aggregans]
MAEKKAASKSAKKAPRKAAMKEGSATTAADVVDEQLARYRSMRDFKVTAEPSGTSGKSKAKGVGLPFCVQKHAASHLHYDFRLGWNGVLKSWAIAKGPSYVTADKRLAVQVEDHPMEYGGFEGIIPQGQYGGGTVMVWDQGTWEPQPGHTDVDAGLRDGSLKFILHGTKLKGKWALIRMGGKWAKEKKPNWLLIKEHDEFERRADEPPVTEAELDSVVTGRSIDEIAKQEDHVWNSKETRSGGKAWFRKESAAEQQDEQRTKDFEQRLRRLPKEQQPRFLEPQLATMAEVPPSSEGWLHELKLDGYRMQARKEGKRVQMLTRTGLDWTARMRLVANEIAKLPVENVTLDGEVVVVAPNGTTSFADLQASMQEGAKHELTYFAFDLLHLEGKRTRELPLKERKQLLSEVLGGVNEDRLRLNEHIETGGEELLREACRLKAEGIVSKRAACKYMAGRSHDWLKMKCLHEQEFVVGGYTLPTNGIRGVGALLLGYYRDGKLIYAGRTGTGFTQKTHRMLRDRLEGLARETSPLESVPADAKKGARWVKPEMVVQVRFSTWTADDLIRQSAFLGVREDKAAKEVVREESEVSLGPRRSRPKSAAHRSDAGESIAAKRSSMKSADATTSEHAPVRLTHPDKVLDAESGLTKQMLADYYWQVAEHLLPHIAGRPVSLVRCPDGAGKPCFFQKHVNATLPNEIRSVDVRNRKTGEVEPYVTVDTAEALTGLAQLGVMELHPWGSRNDDLEHADRLVFDLDPDESLEWPEVTKAAEEVRARLKTLGLESFVKTTGGKGLHVVAPIEPELAWPEVKEFARGIVAEMEKAAPNRYLTKMTKSARVGKIFLDYLRNEREATSVAAYSPRARKVAAVSMPLSWAELRSKTRPVFRVADFADWRARLKKDPWARMEEVKQRIRA